MAKNFEVLRQELYQKMTHAALAKHQAVVETHLKSIAAAVAVYDAAIAKLLPHIENGVDLAVYKGGRIDSAFVRSLLDTWTADPDHRAIHINLRGVKTAAELLDRFISGCSLNLTAQYGYIAVIDAMFEMLRNFDEAHRVMVIIEPAGKIALFRNIEGWLRSKVQCLSRVSFVFIGTKKDVLPMFGDRNRAFYKQALLFDLSPLIMPRRLVGGHDEMFQRLMQRPGFKKAYDALDAKYAIIEEIIRARKETNTETDAAALLEEIPPDLLTLAVKVLGSPKDALTWLMESSPVFAGERPIKIAQTEEGALKVKALLDQVSHSINS